MDPQIWALILLLLSMVLLFAEVMIPSGGLIFFSSMICLGLAIYSGWTAWGTSSPTLFWVFVAMAVILLPSSVIAAFKVFPHTSMGRKLERPAEEEVTHYQEEQQRLQTYLGKVGETATPLNPAGMLLMGHERFHCFSQGQIVERGTPVKVIAVSGNRLQVRPLSLEEGRQSTLSENQPTNIPQKFTNDFDFDLPPTENRDS